MRCWMGDNAFLGGPCWGPFLKKPIPFENNLPRRLKYLFFIGDFPNMEYITRGQVLNYNTIISPVYVEDALISWQMKFKNPSLGGKQIKDEKMRSHPICFCFFCFSFLSPPIVLRRLLIHELPLQWMHPPAKFSFLRIQTNGFLRPARLS